MMVGKHSTIGDYETVSIRLLPQLASQLGDGLLAGQWISSIRYGEHLHAWSNYSQRPQKK